MNRRPDIFFGREQQQKLESLMLRWREARDRGQLLSISEMQDLDALVSEELYASTLRAVSTENHPKYL